MVFPANPVQEVRIISKNSDVSKYTIAGGDIITDATAESVEWNKEFITQILGKYLGESRPMHVFEVGSGTGGQAVYFCDTFRHIVWHTSDRGETYPQDLIATVRASQLANLLEPVIFDIEETLEIPRNGLLGGYDVIFSSNVVHCIPWESTEMFFQKAADGLKKEGLFILYGPYNIADDANIEGKYTSIGNQKFDEKLHRQDPRLGLREIGDMQALAQKYGFDFVARHDHTEENNYILVFQKK